MLNPGSRSNTVADDCDGYPFGWSCPRRARENVCPRRGRLIKNNAEIVNVVANLVEQLQCELVSPHDARRMLGLDNREVD